MLGLLLILAATGSLPAKGGLDVAILSNENVVISAPAGAKVAWSLPATLTLPSGPGPSPCVVFFAGSGPTDRDWTSPLLPPGGVGSAKLIAEALAAKGVGSIRFDKVGSGRNMKPLEVLSEAHYIAEAVAAWDLLASNKACGRIVLLGHSEGSMHALGAAVVKQSEARFGGFISMSGASRSLLDTAVGQIHDMHAKTGEDMVAVDAALTAFKAAMRKPGAGAPDMTRIPEAASLWLAATDPRQAVVVRELMLADPLLSPKAYRGRALVLTAGNDLQVPRSDADRLFAALATPATAKTLTAIAGANHVYRSEPKSASSISPPEAVAGYTAADRPLAPGVVDALAAFATAAQ